MRRFLLPALLRTGLIAYALLFGHTAHAQQVVVTQPDCIVFFHFTASGQTSPLAPNAGFSNLTNGCVAWNFSYANTGFSAITLAFQSAPNVSGAAGSWSTFSGGTLLAGINPNTNTTGAFTLISGYNPWVRVALTAATGSGTVDGALYGYRIPSAAASAAATSNVNVQQFGGTAVAIGQAVMAASMPVVIASNQSGVPVSGTVTANQGTPGVGAWPVLAAQSSTWTVQPGNTANTTPWLANVGGTAASGGAPSGNPLWWAGLGSGATGGQLYPVTACDSSAVVTVTGGNTTEIVALTASRSIRVCSFSASISLAGSAQFVTGTGTNCGSGTANLTGAYSIATGVTTQQGAGLGEIFKTPASNALCLTAVTGNVSGVVSYAKY